VVGYIVNGCLDGTVAPPNPINREHVLEIKLSGFFVREEMDNISKM
jgi:hypothetical protein